MAVFCNECVIPKYLRAERLVKGVTQGFLSLHLSPEGSVYSSDYPDGSPITEVIPLLFSPSL